MKASIFQALEALHMVWLEIFEISMAACLSNLKVLPSFYISYTIPDNVTASNIQHKQIYFD